MGLMDGLHRALLYFGEEDRRGWEWENNEEYLVEPIILCSPMKERKGPFNIMRGRASLGAMQSMLH